MARKRILEDNIFVKMIPGNQRGIILVFVLVTVVALGGLLAYIRLSSLADLQGILNSKTEKELELSLPAILEIADKKARENSFSSLQLNIKDYKVNFALEQEKEKINVNDPASLEEIREFLAEFEFPAEEISIMVDSLEDWLDPDNDHHLNGAEKEFYQEKGYQPRNGPISSLDEIPLIRGFNEYNFWVSPGLYCFLTTYAIQKDQPLFRGFLKIKYSQREYRYLIIYRRKPYGIKILYQKELPGNVWFCPDHQDSLEM